MLSFDQVDVSIAGVQILRQLSFSIEAAETVALIGRNGAGKTTTLKSVMGLTLRRPGVDRSGAGQASPPRYRLCT